MKIIFFREARGRPRIECLENYFSLFFHSMLDDNVCKLTKN